MFKNKLIIVPTFKIKFATFIQRFLPIKLVMKFIYNYQSGKINKKDV